MADLAVGDDERCQLRRLVRHHDLLGEPLREYQAGPVLIMRCAVLAMIQAFSLQAVVLSSTGSSMRQYLVARIIRSPVSPSQRHVLGGSRQQPDLTGVWHCGFSLESFKPLR